MARCISLGLVLVSAWFASAQSPSVDLLARMRASVERFLQQAPSFVAREDYQQRVSARAVDIFKSTGTGAKRVLISEMLMVRLPKSAGWMSFRDVLSVDGRAIDGRQQRLVDLLQSPRPEVLAEARRLADESARFNLGQLRRTLNVPDIALEYLRAAHASRMEFQGPRQDRLNGLAVAMFSFEETAGPTILRDTIGRDLKASGRVWIDAASAAVVRTELKITERTSTGTCVVDFIWNEALGMHVPQRMTERYRTAREEIDGVATYSDYRRFAVSTSESVGKPPPPAES